MQPVAHGRHRILAIMTLSAAVIMTASLLFTLRAVAADAASKFPANTAKTPSAHFSTEDLGDSARLVAGRGGDDTSDRRANKNKAIGAVVDGPTEGFSGTWLILESGVIVTAIVTADTQIKDFDDGPPVAGEWVEAKGRPQADGTLLVRQFRPNKFVPSEVVARLTVTAVLSDVLNKYRAYQLTPITALLSSASIYRFAVGEDQDEKAVAAVLESDKANFIWAEVNYVSEIPSGPLGNPYRSWKWGSSDPKGYISQNAYAQINLAPALGVYSGMGVTVAVLDTGIDANHPVFRGHLAPGRDLVDDDAVPQDGLDTGKARGTAQGHGTHVSGVIARIAPESMILPLRVLNEDGRGNTFVLAYAVDWAVRSGADVLNLSLGTDCDSNVLRESIQRAISQGVIVIAAAGNGNVEAPQCPAGYPGVLGITAVDDARHKAVFANYGAGWVDLAAPGVGITSTVPVSGSILYGTWSGTSMATPFAAGAAALVRQQLPQARPDDVAEILVRSGGDLDATNPDYIGKVGRLLNVGAALADSPGQNSVALFMPAVMSR